VQCSQSLASVQHPTYRDVSLIHPKQASINCYRSTSMSPRRVPFHRKFQLFIVWVGVKRPNLPIPPRAPELPYREVLAFDFLRSRYPRIYPLGPPFRREYPRTCNAKVPENAQLLVTKADREYYQLKMGAMPARRLHNHTSPHLLCLGNLSLC